MKQISLVFFVLISLFIAGCSSNETMPENTIPDENLEDEGNESTSSDVDRVIEIDAFNFGYSQEEIRVKQGETVRIVMTSTQGTHDFVVDELDIQSAVISQNGQTTFEFEADEIGEFEFYCSIGSHRQAGMFGSLIIEE